MAEAVYYKFSRGEWDPRLNGRSDLEQYYAASKEATNVFVIPQGGFTRRPGLEYIDTVSYTLEEYAPADIDPKDPDTNNSNSTTQLPYLKDNDLSTYYTTTTNISTTNPYVVFKYDLSSSITIAYVDIRNVALTSGTSTEFVIQYSTDGSTWSSASQTITLDTTERDFRIRINEAAAYIRLARIGSTDLGSAKIKLAQCNVWKNTSTISETKMFTFNYSDTEKYILLMSDQNINIYLNDVVVASIISPYTSAQITSVNSTHYGLSEIFFHQDVAPYELFNQSAGGILWKMSAITFDNIPKVKYNENKTNPAATLEPSAVSGYITLTAGSSIFSSDDVGQYVDGGSKWGGRARIVKYTSDVKVDAITTIPFYATSAITSGEWTKTTGYDDLWSSSKGYPSCGTFYKQRLVMGGFKSRPNIIAASTIDDYYDYDLGQADDDDAFAYALESNRRNEIYHIFPHQELEIFCSDGIFTTNIDKVFKASTVEFVRQMEIGASKYVRPVELENGGTLFVQADGSSVSELIYSDSTIDYQNRRISLLSAHLMNSPIDGTLRRATNLQEVNYYFQVNSDGNLIVACLLEEQNISAFSECETDGDFTNVIALGDDIYCIVERTIDGTTYKYLEKFSFDHTTDCYSYLLKGDSQIDGTEYAPASITASTTNGGTTSYLKDELSSTTFTNTTGISTTDNYVSFEYDLSSDQSVDYISLKNLSISTGSTEEFQIEYSTDNFSSDINVVSNTISITTTATDFEIPIGSSTRYIRLIRNGTTDLGSAVLSLTQATVYLDKDVTVSGLDYLEGKSVWTIIDGYYCGPETVSSGTITLDANVFTDLEIGLDYVPRVETNAIELPQIGPLIGKLVTIKDIWVNLYNTQHVLIAGYSPFSQNLGTSTTLGSPPSERTGRYRMLGIMGWDESKTVVITQTYPTKMTVLNLAVNFTVGSN